MEHLRDTNRNIRAFLKEHELIKSETEDILKNLDEQKNGIRLKKKELDEKLGAFNALKLENSALNEAISSRASNIARIGEDMRLVSEFVETARSDIRLHREQILERENEIAEIEKSLKLLAERSGGAKAEAEDLSAKKAETAAETARLRESLNDVYEVISTLGSELTRFEMRKEQTEQDMKKLYDDMWEKYNVTYQSALEHERLELGFIALQREEASLKNEIKALGAVNVAAVDEYAAFIERLSFMSNQRDDIINAEAKLREIIGDLTKLMEKQFLERFAAISESFGVVFGEMFGGGRAYLKLQEPDNALESGIDIISQPPGKNLQNMMLFSGGERALTAIALLFSILRLKPSPFCILDEIEAALDDANVTRFAEYIKNFNKDSTQFILITHRKGTMETADVLYGVTMQERGVSKLVSVKLTDVAE
jgi:chromosome segregation protein